MPFHVDSEAGKLRQVILHRPGLELERLTPGNKDELLFDDVLWVQRAQEEHDFFAQTLRDRGVTVHLFGDLLTETLAVPEARNLVMDRLFDAREYGPIATDWARHVYEGFDPAQLTRHLVGGITKRELVTRMGPPRSVRVAVMHEDDFVVAPLPNHLFTRDTSCWVYDGVAVNAMRKQARRRESVHFEAIYRYHPLFADRSFNLWNDGQSSYPATMEGGDVLVIGNGAVLVGMSERTTPQGVEQLAVELFKAGSARRIVALDMPKQRAFMHLDTVMTMVDGSTFTKYAGLGMLPSYTIEPQGAPDDLLVTRHEPQDMHRVIADALGMERITTLTTAQGTHAAEREQWDDGCNVLTIAPGVVVAYDRNAASNQYLEDNGIEVIRVRGGELGRGRGGPRCMSCPIERDAV
ncbi:arginine deiminase [Streptomyces antarcticus]|uniref:arginine deiminase n=1 Tax=Streptomyces antarcticus TaxID=2996458 RepID=UPI0022710FBC|nr:MULTISPECIES: arginine deiminase [unclassified Streptomyces]MCY0944511.1 arginine deiminase [Streptomyces sp. H34-AA3]MCZ4084540.1 arginine deiminase [Streptomyces sp. H34-S5]